MGSVDVTVATTPRAVYVYKQPMDTAMYEVLTCPTWSEFFDLTYEIHRSQRKS